MHSKLKRQEGEPAKRLLCYYGDDFTGSTDVLESLFQAGLKTVLFLEPPTAELLNGQFHDVVCFGVAGVGRSLTPQEMEKNPKDGGRCDHSLQNMFHVRFVPGDRQYR
jgi:hypothetical protein